CEVGVRRDVPDRGRAGVLRERGRGLGGGLLVVEDGHAASSDGGRREQGKPETITRPTHPDRDRPHQSRTEAAASARRVPAGYIRNTPKRAGSIGALSEAEMASPSTRRVSAGSMMPSSQSRAVAYHGLP